MDTFDVKELDYDPRAENSNNLLEEEILITADCPWIIPNGSPFFAKDIKLFGNGGAPLKVNQHYKLEVGLTPLRSITGKEVFSFIKLTPTTLAAYTKITVRYRSVGVRYFPRNGIEDWITKIKEGAAHADWNTNVINKPLTYPASDHWHDMNTEIGDWDELTWFFQAMANRNSSDDTAAKDAVEKLEKTAFASVSTPYKTCLDIINTHDVNYANPHKTTKAHLLLGNVANVGTGTIADHVSSDNDNLLATPGGIAEILAGKKINDSSIMRVGSLPISLLGNGTYIPPLIDGSFEGIGSRFETGAMCLEPNGDLMVLGNQYDGRIDDLYYSVVNDYQKNSIEIFTAFRYINESLNGFGVRPNYVIGGSGPEIIMVGVLADAQYAYISFTNGTLDPSKHNYFKVDISEITTGEFRSANTNNMNNGTVLLMGDWIYFVSRRNMGDGEATGARFYRLRVSDLKSGSIAKFICMRISFTSMDNIAYQDVLDFRFATSNVFTNDQGISQERYYWDFVPKPGWISHGWRALRVWHAAVPGSNNKKFAIHLRTKMDFTYRYKGNSSDNNYNIAFDAIYHIDPETGHMTLQKKTPYNKIMFDENQYHDATLNIIRPHAQMTGSFHHDMAYGSTVILEDGTLLYSSTDDAKTYPRYVNVSTCGKKSRYDAVMTPLNLIDAPALADKRISFKLASPLPSGIYQHQLMLDKDGEFYSARAGNSLSRYWFFRKLKGDWIIRDGITNLDLPDLKSRPLTTEVYKTTVPVTNTITTMTGDAEVLAGSGTEMGAMSWASCILRNSKEIGAASDYKWDKHVDGSWYSFPRTVSKTFDEGNKIMNPSYDTYYTMDEGVANALYALMNGSDGYVDPVFALSIFQQGSEDGGPFRGINFAVCSLHGIHITENWTMMWLYTLRMNIESPNANHPNSYKILGFDVISRAFNPQNIRNITGRTFGINTADYTANIQIYRSGQELSFYWRTAISRPNTGNNQFHQCQFKTNLNGEFTEEPSLSQMGWNMGPTNLQVLPKVGFRGGYSYNGGSAYTMSVSEGNYLLTSVYPEVGWILFFQEGTPVVFNGTDYLMPQGSIDLRDIDPDPRNKTFYVYATVVGSTTKYFVSSIEMSQGPFLIKAAVVVTNEKQIFSINRYQTFMVGSYVIQPNREGGTIPVSNGLPMEEGSLNYFTKQDLGIH